MLGTILFFQDKGVRMMVVAVGPKSKYPKHKKVLESIAGDDVYYASAYDSFGALFDDVAKAICGKWSMHVLMHRMAQLTKISHTK